MDPAAPNPQVETLDPATCRQLLATQSVGRVAYVWDHEPQIVPVNFVLVEDRVVFRSDPGHKVEHMPLHRVCFEADGSIGDDQVWSVVVHGLARDVTTALNDEYERMRQQDVLTFATLSDPHWIAIDVERIEGRRLSR